MTMSVNDAVSHTVRQYWNYDVYKSKHEDFYISAKVA